MKKQVFYLITALLLAGAGIRAQQPGLGKIVDGYLVNVDDRGVILQGYDPVSLRDGHSAQGDPAFQTKHKGAIYYFVSAENKARFEADPTLYQPEYGGYCAYGVSVGHLAPIELWTYDTSYQHRNIYQHNQKAVDGWKKDVPGNDKKAKKQWRKFERKYLKKA